jgi:S1-C subfamily serine protease
LPDAVPMCTVGVVYPHSPAKAAGLCAGDAVLSFGAVRLADFVSVGETLAPMVKEHVGKPISVVVSRVEDGSEAHVGLRLTPDTWSGKGLRGCSLK